MNACFFKRMVQMTHFLVLSLLLSSGPTYANNISVRAGEAGYIVWEPIWSIFYSNQFLEVMTGPSSTGFQWKHQTVRKISLLPQTFDEELEMMSSDSIRLLISAHVTMRPAPEKEKIKELVESYGAENWYKSFIQAKFKTIIRQAVGIISSHEAIASQNEIEAAIDRNLREFCKDKPFEVDVVVLGNIQLPKAVSDAAALKAATTQQLEAKAAELEKAKKDAEIKVAEARGIRESQEIINGTLTPMYLQHEYIQALIKVGEKGNSIVYVPTGFDGLPFLMDPSGGGHKHSPKPPQ